MVWPTHPGPFKTTSIPVIGNDISTELDDYQLHTKVQRAVINYLESTLEESDLLIDLEENNDCITDNPDVI